MIKPEVFAGMLDVLPALLIYSSICDGTLKGMPLPEPCVTEDGKLMFPADKVMHFVAQWHARKSIQALAGVSDAADGPVTLREFASMADVPALEMHMAVTRSGKLHGVSLPDPIDKAGLTFSRTDVDTFLYMYRFSGKCYP